MQKILFGLWVKKFTFSILSSLKLFLTQLNYVATIVFRADTDNIRKIVNFTYTLKIYILTISFQCLEQFLEIKILEIAK